METNTSSQRTSMIVVIIVLLLASLGLSFLPETDTYNPFVSFLDHLSNLDGFIAAAPNMVWFGIIAMVVVELVKRFADKFPKFPILRDWHTNDIKLVTVFVIWVGYFFVQEFSFFTNFEFYLPSIEQTATYLVSIFGSGMIASKVYSLGKEREEPWAKSRKSKPALG